MIQNQLPSNIVSFDHVRTLIKLQSCNDLKIAPHLKEVHVNPGQYQKMKVNLAAQVLSHTTATALKFCVDRKLICPEALTTAWFLQTIND